MDKIKDQMDIQLLNGIKIKLYYLNKKADFLKRLLLYGHGKKFV